MTKHDRENKGQVQLVHQTQIRFEFQFGMIQKFEI